MKQMIQCDQEDHEHRIGVDVSENGLERKLYSVNGEKFQRFPDQPERNEK